MEMKKVTVSEGTIVSIRGTEVEVYAPVFDKYIEIQDKFAKFEKITDRKKQTEAAIEMLYDLLEPYNKGITKEKIKATFTMEAFMTVIRIAFNQTVK